MKTKYLKDQYLLIFNTQSSAQRCESNTKTFSEIPVNFFEISHFLVRLFDEIVKLAI